MSVLLTHSVDSPTYVRTYVCTYVYVRTVSIVVACQGGVITFGCAVHMIGTVVLDVNG